MLSKSWLAFSSAYFFCGHREPPKYTNSYFPWLVLFRCLGPYTWRGSSLLWTASYKKCFLF